MIKNIIIIFLIIFIINYNNIIVSSFIIKDVTPKTTASYKQLVGNNDQCRFNYLIYCEPSNLSESCDPLTTYFNSENLKYYTSVSNNGTTYIHTWIIDSPVGTYRINFNSILNVNFECIDYDLNQIEFKLIGDGYFIYPNQIYQTLQVIGVYEMIGLSSTIDPKIVSFKGIKPSNSQGSTFINIANSNKFIFQSSFLKNTISYLNQSVNITRSVTNNRQFNLEPLFKDTYDSIYDIKIYPDEEYLANLELLGNGEAAIIQFTSNNTILKSPFIITYNGENIGTQSYPISGTNTSTTYLVSTFISDYQYGFSYIELYYSSGGIFNQLNKTFQPFLQFSSDTIPNQPTVSQTPYGEIPIVSIGFQDSKMYGFSSLNIQSGLFKYLSSFPMGFVIGSPSAGYRVQIDYLIKPYYNSLQNFMINIVSGQLSFPVSNQDTSFVYDSTSNPSIKKVETIHLFKERYLYRLHISCPYDLYYIQVGDKDCYYTKQALVSGDLKYGVYEIVVPVSSDITISVFDIYGGVSSLTSTSILSFSPLDIHINPVFVPNFDLSQIQNVSFLYNDIDVTNFKHYNVLYFNFSNPFPKDISISMLPTNFGLSDPRGFISNDRYFYSTFNESLQLFQIEFFVEGNTAIGEFQFILQAFNGLLYSNMLDTKLRIKNSLIDLQGPIFKVIKKSNVYIDEVNKYGEIGWSITIEDSINGFSYGYITIRAEIDQSIYNITVTSNQVKEGGTIYLGEYDFKFNVTYSCKPQTYVITEVVLYDTRGRLSYFSIYPINPKYTGVLNPFINFLNDSSINKIPVSCATYSAPSNDISAPTLNQFIVSTTTIDVSKTIREVSFNASLNDPQSGLKIGQDLIIYLSSTNLRTITCPLKFYKLVGTESFYYGTIQLPLGFGYPDGILISIYNLINNNGFYTGFASTNLKDNGKDYYIETLFDTIEPTITDYLRFDERGGDLWLIGRGFEESTQAFITFRSGLVVFESEFISSTIIKVPGVNATDKPFRVYIQTSQFTSNEIIVTPYIIGYNDRPTVTPSSTPTTTPISTNKPQKCLGNPICGGPSNGICIENQGCVCYSPWIGIDCLSKVIIVDQPKTNDSIPSTEIILPGSNDNNSGSDDNLVPISYRSLVSLVALREIDINGKLIVDKPFEKWIVNKLNNSTFIYKSSLKDITTNITVTLEWFTNQSTISFANEDLLMNPSTMKYTIEIDSYPFESRLNILELVMSAYIESNTTKSICSAKEFGETTSGDNSNYIKVQVDDHSLFGRFIKRGVIDSVIRSITNVQLDKDMKPITTTKQIQSFIGIQIPNYKTSVIIDPDFSVVLDSYSASSNSNSICSSSSSSKLSTGKIIGIVLGCVGFATVAVIAITYHLIRKKRFSKFILNVNQKMKQINNDKL